MKEFDIQFGSHIMAKLIIENDTPNINGYIDGYGNAIGGEEIIITEIENPNTASPVKTLQECENKVARNHKLNTWQNLIRVSSRFEIDEYHKEVAKMYANQPKGPVNVVTDDELRSHADKIHNQWSESEVLSVYDCMVEMATWMRKQLTNY